MRRYEAVVLLAVALALVVTGVVWLAGPWGLVGSGVVLAAVALTVFDVKEDRHGQAVASPSSRR
jgi:hypothetical protein